MSVINVPTMRGYQPKLLNGMFVGQVDDVKQSTGGKGYTLFMTLVDASEACMDQPWQNTKVMYWFGTDMSQAKDPFQQRQWKDRLYFLAKAFGIESDEIDTDLLIGERVGVNIRSSEKDGAIKVDVDGLTRIKE